MQVFFSVGVVIHAKVEKTSLEKSPGTLYWDGVVVENSSLIYGYFLDSKLTFFFWILILLLTRDKNLGRVKRYRFHVFGINCVRRIAARIQGGWVGCFGVPRNLSATCKGMAKNFVFSVFKNEICLKLYIFEINHTQLVFTPKVRKSR